MHEVEDVGTLASDWGASLLQFHPFEPTGRGTAGVDKTSLRVNDRLDAFLLTAILAEEYLHMRVQLDLVHRDVERHFPFAIHGAPLRQPMEPRELVLQEDGRVVPLTYGLDSAWDAENLARERLAESWPALIV
jgi:MoaA/NifB/PqqE/SkfB family radical SAM enzyme